MGNLTAKISTNDYNLYNEKNTYYNDTILARDTRKRNSEVLEINKRITMDVFQRSGRGGAGNFHHKDASTTKVGHVQLLTPSLSQPMSNSYTDFHHRT